MTSIKRSRKNRAFGIAAATVAGVGLLFAAGCSTSGNNADNAAADGTGSEGGAGTVQVFAAASLNNVGEELAAAFAEEHDGAELEYNFAGSSRLVQQIEQGADADLFISADQENMDNALQLPEFEGAEPEIIATNLLVLATAPGNPAGIESLEDLRDNPDARIALCADGVPCGTLANQVLDDEGITLNSPTEEANVSDVSTKVATGEVDAGFIYSTDAIAMQENNSGDDITVITIADTVDIEPNLYPAALTTDGEDNETAREFFGWLTSDRAREILESYGFGAAES